MIQRLLKSENLRPLGRRLCQPQFFGDLPLDECACGETHSRTAFASCEDSGDASVTMPAALWVAERNGFFKSPETIEPYE